MMNSVMVIAVITISYVYMIFQAWLFAGNEVSASNFASFEPLICYRLVEVKLQNICCSLNAHKCIFTKSVT